MGKDIFSMKANSNYRYSMYFDSKNYPKTHNKKAMMALYRSTAWYVKSLYQTLQYLGTGLTLSQTTDLNSSKVNQSADDNFKFDENSTKFSNRVETLSRKEKLLLTSNFSFPYSVLKACFPGASKGVIVWKWVKT